MAGNTFGTLFRITTFGESHGPYIGVVIDGCPAGFKPDLDLIQLQLNRRRPGQSSITTARNEEDSLEIISGLNNSVTTGSPLCIIIKNKDARPGDYTELQNVFRPSHADYTYNKKYGNRDHRGGGRSSARETAMRVVAGSLAAQFLADAGIRLTAYVSQVGEILLDKNYKQLDFSLIDASKVRCPHIETSEKMISYLETLKTKGDSCGGVISCIVSGNLPPLGEPVFDKLNADLAKAMLSINAAHGFEYGSGFSGASMLGSQHNDEPYVNEEGLVKFKTNNAGGILGGIANGDDIYFKVAFKPVATISLKQNTIDTDGNSVIIEAKGRHDPCVVPRAVPVVEAMAAMTLFDHYLRNKAAQW